MANTRFKLIFGDKRIIPAGGIGVVEATLEKANIRSIAIARR